MTGWLTTLGPDGTALALLVAGHVLADFVFQTDAIARTKHRIKPLLAHGGIVLLVHLLTFTPLLTRDTTLIVAALAVTHLLIDAVTAHLRHRRGPSLHLFLADQSAHLLILFGAWSLIDATAWTTAPVVARLGGVTAVPWTAVTTAAVYVAAFAFAHKGGNTIVQRVLPDDAPEPATEDDLEAGSLIGSLERWIVLLLGVASLWEAVALVVTAKSIARFEELKQRPFAEYFLVGTLTSILVAIGLVALVTAAL